MWPFKKKANKQIDDVKLNEGHDLLHQAAHALGSSADEVAKYFKDHSLEDFERRLKNIMKLLSDSVIIINLKHEIIIMNEAAEQTFGYGHGELLGENLSILMPSVHAERHDGYVNSYVSKHPECEQYSSHVVGHIREIRGKKKNGELFPMELSITELTTPTGDKIFMGVIRDISKHKKQEEILKSQRRFYHTILDSLPVNIFIKDHQGKYGFINNKYKDTFHKTNDEVIGFKDDSIWSISTAAQAVEEDILVRTTKQPFYTERRINGKDYFIAKTLVEDDQGESIVGFSLDITDIKEAEKKIEEQRIKIKVIFDSSPFGMCSINENGRITEINKKLVNMLGYTYKRELIGKNILEYAVSGHESDILELLDIAEEDGFAQKDIILITKDDTRLYFKITANLIFDDSDTVNFIITADDITQDKNQEDRIAVLATAMNAASDVIAITDSNANIVFVNDAFLDHYGYSRAEAIGSNPRILNSGIHNKKFYSDMYAKITKGKTWEGYITNKKKDGTMVEDYMVINPIKDSSGRIAYYQAIKRINRCDK